MTSLQLQQLNQEQITNLPPLLQALWHDAHNNWRRSHEITQDIATADAAWLHAYLHRKEGDHGNAAYWYRQAHKPLCRLSLEAEWQQIATELLRSFQPDETKA